MELFTAYIDQSVNDLAQEEKSLADSDRKDESNLVKIRINVYGICKTIYKAFVKQDGQTESNGPYLRKLDELAQNWKLSYEKAIEHDDVKKAVIEEIKIQTLEEIRNKFMATEEN